ncbi:MAG: hypothetical protein RMZ43_008035 [Nostoc sp. CmiVER01]|nr:hypothetical protein [Nostoc sp. CmiVER01]MDZ8123347.1 hypothetical protein [Nostoc sp. CmiVER01]
MAKTFYIEWMDGTIILLQTEFNAHLVRRRWRAAYSMLFKAIAWLLC